MGRGAGDYRSKKNGVILGRPKGQAEKLKLDPKGDQIEKYLSMGLGIRPTAKLIDEAPSTLRNYIKRRGLRATTVAESA
ncbi:hypothetical protein VrSk94_32430 [Vibrio rotiferianus]